MVMDRYNDAALKIRLPEGLSSAAVGYCTPFSPYQQRARIFLGKDSQFSFIPATCDVPTML